MSNINQLVYEALEKGYSGHTMGNVGSGAGKMVGGIFGYHIGKKSVDDPDAPMDETKRGQRLAVMVDKMNSLKQLKHAALGAGLGALAGSGLSAIEGSPIGNGLTAGTAIGALAGGIGSQMHSGYKTAKDLGYGGFGKTMGTISPMTGLFTPKKVKEAQEEALKKSGKINS